MPSGILLVYDCVGTAMSHWFPQWLIRGELTVGTSSRIATRSLAMAIAVALTILFTPLASGAIVFPTTIPDLSPSQTLTDPISGDSGFGSVAIDGDTAVIGAHGYDRPNADMAGAAHVYTRDGSAWKYQTTLLASNPTTEARFGTWLDVDGDTIAVGAWADDEAANSAGAVYVFKRSGNSWSEEDKLMALDAEAGDKLGSGVSICGDTIVAGAYGDDTASGVDAGSAYVFVRSGSSWVEQDKLMASAGTAEDSFGLSTGISGDTVVVGASRMAGDGDGPGSATVFVRSGNTWSEQQHLTAPNAMIGDYFGLSVAIDRGIIAVGAPNDDNSNGVDAGSVYIFERTNSTWHQMQNPIATGGGSKDRFGCPVSVTGGTVAIEASVDSGAGYGRALYRGVDDWAEGRNLVGTGADDGPETTIAASDDRVLRGAWAIPPDGVVWAYDLERDYTPAPLAGTDRYQTAVQVSETAFPKGSEYVIIATGRNWPDALAGSGLAGALDAPILLVAPTSIPGAVADEIERLGAADVYILGGTGAVSDAVLTQLESIVGADRVERLAGTNRYLTAEAIATETIDILGSSWDGMALVATGGNYPDALAGSPLAAGEGWPVYLARPNAESPASLMKGDGVDTALILGGTAAVSSAQETDLKSKLGTDDVERLWGTTRYATALAIAEYAETEEDFSWDGLALATGQNFPDALSGGVLCGRRGTVLLLTPGSQLHGGVADSLTDRADAVGTVFYLGGTGAVSQAVRDSVASILE